MKWPDAVLGTICNGTEILELAVECGLNQGQLTCEKLAKFLLTWGFSYFITVH